MWERYDTRYLYFLHRVRLSVRFSVRLSLGVCFNFRLVLQSDFKNSFFCWRGISPDTYLYLINCFRLPVRFFVRLSVRSSVRLSLESFFFRLLTILTVRFQKLSSVTYLSYKCPSVCPYHKNFFRLPESRVFFQNFLFLHKLIFLNNAVIQQIKIIKKLSFHSKPKSS